MKPGPVPFFDPAACGTSKQYRKHLLHGIPLCERCRQAENRRTSGRYLTGCYSRRPWTPEEDALVFSDAIPKIAETLERSYSSVKGRRAVLRTWESHRENSFEKLSKVPRNSGDRMIS